MRCGDCPAAKRIGSRRIECVQYGMILLESHECTREGWKSYGRGRDGGPRGEVREETGFFDYSGGTAEEMQRVLSGSGE